jgi:glycyl-tRNA synthetase alpha subunit
MSASSPIAPKLYYQDAVLKLKSYWAERGCIIQEPYDLEVGAGTMAPETFLRVLGPKQYRVAYVQPAGVRPTGAMEKIRTACISTSSCR